MTTLPAGLCRLPRSHSWLGAVLLLVLVLLAVLRSWAGGRVMDYIYKEDGRDWALVAERLEEVVAQLPQKVDAGVELGNAYVRLGSREEAIRSYQRLLDQDKIPVEAKIAAQLRGQIGRVRDAADISRVAPMRNPWLE